MNSGFPLICFLALCLSSFAVSAQSGDDPCEPTDGWTYYNYQEYAFFPQLTRFAESQEACFGLNGNLASVHSDEDNDFLVFLTGVGTDFHLGARRLTEGGSFVWLDGSEWDYTNFADGEPNNMGGSEKCLGTKGGSGLWNDRKCGKGKSLGFVCQRSIDGCFPPTPSPTVSPTFSPTPAPTGSPTVSPTTSPTLSPTTTTTPSPTPTPTSSPTGFPTRSPTTLSPTPSPTTSTTTTPSPTPAPTPSPTETTTTTPAPSPAPSPAPTTLPSPAPTPSPTADDDEFPDFGDFEFWFVGEPSKIVYARSVCLAWGGDVASVHSDAENTFIWTLAGSGTVDYWLGAKRTSVGGSYEWTDGSTWDYDNWFVGEPNDDDKFCLTTKDQGLQWADVRCGEGSKRPYVCKRDKNL